MMANFYTNDMAMVWKGVGGSGGGSGCVQIGNEWQLHPSDGHTKENRTEAVIPLDEILGWNGEIWYQLTPFLMGFLIFNA